MAFPSKCPKPKVLVFRYGFCSQYCITILQLSDSLNSNMFQKSYMVYNFILVKIVLNRTYILNMIVGLFVCYAFRAWLLNRTSSNFAGI